MKKKIVIFLLFLFLILIFHEKIFNQQKYNKFIKNIEECNIDFLENVPLKSTLIVGHAYGSPSNSKDEFISKKIEKFIINNNNNIETVIFTGDIFKIPTVKKWKDLKNFAENNKIKILIAPGNHDVGFGENNQNIIFNNSNLSPSDYPFFTFINDRNIIIENSSTNNWSIDKKVLEIIENKPSSNFILFVHHVLVDELLYLANSKEGIPNKLLKFDDLKDFNLTVISGDSGAFESLPRISCHQKGSLKYITNGIGDVTGDTVLILNDSKIYAYELE